MHCGYVIVGAGSTNNEETTLFAPVIFKQQRNIRTTGNNGTLWLSETPQFAFTKLEKASSYEIATWMHLKVAVHQEYKRNDQSAFEKLLNALKKADTKKKRRSRPATKWIDLYVVNTKFDTEDSQVAKEQLNILLEYLKEKVTGDGEENAVVLTAGVASSMNTDLSEILENEGYQDAIRNTRADIDDDVSKIPGSTIVWSKGLENVVSTNVETKSGQNAALSALLFS